LAARSELSASGGWSVGRLQQGRPQAPAEINERFNPFELGLAERVSLNKGCYVGQETLPSSPPYDGVKQQPDAVSVPRPGAAAQGLAL